jgi:hypothetical protein
MISIDQTSIIVGKKAGFWINALRCLMFDTGYSILDTGYWIAVDG